MILITMPFIFEGRLRVQVAHPRELNDVCDPICERWYNIEDWHYHRGGWKTANRESRARQAIEEIQYSLVTVTTLCTGGSRERGQRENKGVAIVYHVFRIVIPI